MAEFKVKIPTITEAFYDSNGAKANKEKVVSSIRPKYGKFIDNTATMSNVPSELIESLIFIESGGNANASSPYAVGLMQVGLASASDGLIKEKGAGRLSADEEKIVKAKLGARYDSIIAKVKPKQTTIGKTFITKQDLLDPEFNILVGTMIFKQLMDEFTEKDGNIRIDKAIVLYNGGRYGAVAKKVIPFTGTTADLVKMVPKETSAYILKLLGTQGLLDVLV